jgi:sarcosine oxidase
VGGAHPTKLRVQEDSMSETYDCIVLGVGGFGAGTLYHLAKRGVSVLGLERFEIAHDRGSSHGETRIIRKAYVEHPDYVPLVLSAYKLWNDLEAESGQTLFHNCGLLLFGLPDSEAIAGSRLAVAQHGVEIQKMDFDEARRKYPGYRFPDGIEVMYDADAGFLEVEHCTQTHVNQAQKHDAVVNTGETVVKWSSDGTAVRVRTDHNEYQAARLIITAGAWATELLADLSIPLEVVRKPLFWHETTSDHYNASQGAPTFYFELPTGDIFYGFPSIDGKTVKLAEHTGGKPVSDPLNVDREIHSEDTEPIASFISQCMPGLKTEPSRHSVCMYTLTPDHHFIVDRHPRYENVTIAAGFSGHGYKFTSVLGQAMADLSLDGKTDHPIEFLSINREALQ